MLHALCGWFVQVASSIKQEEAFIVGTAESVTLKVPAFCTKPNDNAKDTVDTTIENVGFHALDLFDCKPV